MYKAYGPECEQPMAPSSEHISERIEQFLMQLEMDKEAAMKLEKETQCQSDSGLWRHHRHVRLTASNFGKVINRRPATKVALLVKSLLYSTFKGNRATQHGISEEDSTNADYIRFKHQTGCKVTTHPAGLAIFQNDNTLGASCDRYVTDHSICEEGIVEFKNLYTDKTKTIIM